MAKRRMDLESVGADPDMLAVQYETGNNLRSRVSIYQYLHPEEPIDTTFEAWVLDHLGWKGTETAADVGCGPGSYMGELVRRAGRIVAIDLSFGMLKEAREVSGRSSEVALIAGDAQQLPLADKSVDVLLAAHMLYHVKDVDAALAEFRRVVKPGGTLLIVLNGMDDKYEIRSVWEEAGSTVVGDTFRAPHWGATVNLDNAPQKIAKHFSLITVDRLRGQFRFPSAGPPITWIESLRDGTEATLSDEEWRDIVGETRSRVSGVIDREGTFCASKDSGIVLAL
jgi:SAM-dependent methyltransferase